MSRIRKVYLFGKEFYMRNIVICLTLAESKFKMLISSKRALDFESVIFHLIKICFYFFEINKSDYSFHTLNLFYSRKLIFRNNHY